MDHLTHIRDESDAFLAAALDGGLDVAVPSCPDWTMADLVGHLGTVQRFHGGHLVRGVVDPPPGPRPTPPETGLAEWFREGTATLLDNLATVGPDAPAWNFLGAEPLTTAFWHRRMVHEAAVHRWDAEYARGRATGFLPEVAVDGVDEVLECFVPGRRRDDDPQGTVVVRLADAGVERTAVMGDADAGRATITGLADDVWLALWGRIPLTDLQVEGDLALARSVRAG